MTNDTIINRVTYDKTIGIVNNNPLGRGFAHPIDIAEKHGELYVLNKHPAFTRVGVCNYQEEYLREFGTYGHGDGQFWLPTGVAVNDDGFVFVSDEFHNNVSIFSIDGKFVENWGKIGNAEGQLDGPSGLAIKPNGNILVVDQNNHRVQEFSKSGEYVNSWGSFGNETGQLNQPWGIAVGSDGSIYVADWGNDRIQRFDDSGSPISIYGGPNESEGSLHRPSKPAVDSDGFVYVSDWGNESVKIYSPEGEYIQSLRGEATLSKWAQEFLDANPDESSQRDISDLMPELPDHFDTPYLISTQIESYFWGPSSVIVGEDSKLYVVESSRHRIQIYNLLK